MFFLLSLLIALVAAHDQPLAHHARLNELWTPVVTMTIYHTTVYSIFAKEPRPSQTVAHHTASISLHPRDLQRRISVPTIKYDKSVSPGSLIYTESIEGLTKRSDNLYALRVPFHEQEGYMVLFVSNSTAVPFCKGISDALYEDSDKVFVEQEVTLSGNSPTKVPVREDNAICFCNGVKEREGYSDDSPPTASAGSRTSRPTATVGSSTNEDSGGEITSAKPSKADKSTAPKSVMATYAEAEPARMGLTKIPIEGGTSSDRGPTRLNTQTSKSQLASITPLAALEASIPSFSDTLTPSGTPMETYGAELSATTQAPAPKLTITAAPHSSGDGSKDDKSPSDQESLPGNHDTVSSEPFECGTEIVDTSTTDFGVKASAKAFGNVGAALVSSAHTRSRSAILNTPLPTPTATQNDDVITADRVNEVAEPTEVQVHDIRQLPSTSSFEESWRTASATRAAMSARTLENAAASRAAPRWWGILTQLVRKRNHEDDASSLESNAEEPDDGEENETAPTTSARIPAKPRPIKSGVETTQTPTPTKDSLPGSDHDSDSSTEDGMPDDSSITFFPRPGKPAKPTRTPVPPKNSHQILTTAMNHQPHPKMIPQKLL